MLARRARVIDTLAPFLEGAYNEIAEEEAAVIFTYRPSWGVSSFMTATAADYADHVAGALEASRRQDYERRMTTTGPHRDEPGFSIAGREARTHGSQGEQRTMALATKLAAHRAIEESVGEAPVLLLDDVFSELDPGRASALAEALPDSQTLITSARPEDVPIAGTKWLVSEGSINES